MWTIYTLVDNQDNGVKKRDSEKSKYKNNWSKKLVVSQNDKEIKSLFAWN